VLRGDAELYAERDLKLVERIAAEVG